MKRIHIHVHDGGPGSGPRKGGGKGTTETPRQKQEREFRSAMEHGYKNPRSKEMSLHTPARTGGAEPSQHRTRIGGAQMHDAGTSEGAKKAWASRKRGGGPSASEAVKSGLERSPGSKSAYESDMMSWAKRSFAKGMTKSNPQRARLLKEAEEHEKEGAAKWNKLNKR